MSHTATFSNPYGSKNRIKEECVARVRERSERGAAAPRGVTAEERSRRREIGGRYEERKGREGWKRDRERNKEGQRGGEEGITQLHVGLMPGSLSLSA